MDLFPIKPDWLKFSPGLDELWDALTGLPVASRLAFAARCCDRLLPFWVEYAASLGVEDGLSPIVDRLWRHVGDQGRSMSDSEIAAGLAVCDSLPLGDEDPPSKACWDAIYAIGAVQVTLEGCRGDSIENVVKAAGCVRDRIDRVLYNKYRIVYPDLFYPTVNVKELHDLIDSDSAMIEELRTESDQLRFLMECERLDDRAVSLLRQI